MLKARKARPASSPEAQGYNSSDVARICGVSLRQLQWRVPVIDANRAARLRWLLLAVFVLSSAINYLDRQALATLAPLVRAEFHLSRAEYGWILGVFSISYALSAPLAGMLTD